MFIHKVNSTWNLIVNRLAKISYCYEKVLLLIIVLRFSYVYLKFWVFEGVNGLPGWTGWIDQSLYYQSATALLQLDFSPQLHRYPLGYQILAMLPVYFFKHHGYGVLNLALCIVSTLCLFKIFAKQVSPGWALIITSFAILYDSQVIFIMTTPWTNNAVIALIGLIFVVFLEDSWSTFYVMSLGLLAGGVFFCRPGDVIFIFPILLYVLISLLRDKKFYQTGILIGSGIIFPIVFLILNRLIYGNIISLYIVQVTGFAINFNGYAQKIYSFLFDDNAAFLTDDKMLIERFPWLIFYAGGAFLLLSEKKWKMLLVQVSALIGFLYDVSFSPMIPPTLILFEGMRLMLPCLVFLGIPGLLFLQKLITLRERWIIGIALTQIVIVMAGFVGIYGIRQVYIPTNITTFTTEEEVQFEIRSKDNRALRYKQLILPGLVSDPLSAAHSDQTIIIKDEIGCLKSQLTHLGLSRAYGVAIPLIADRESAWIKIRLSKKFISDDIYAGLPLIGRSEFCLLCKDRYDLLDEVSKYTKRAQPLEGLEIILSGGSQRFGYLQSGWSQSEPTHTFTEGNSAEILLPPAKKASDLYFELVTASLGAQRVSVSLNGHHINDLKINFSNLARIGFILPGKFLNTNSENTLVFELPDARTPASLGMNNDNRVLALGVQKISISDNDKPPLARNLVISFAGQRPSSYLGEGWGATEASHTWTDGPKAWIYFPQMKKTESVFFQLNAKTSSRSEQRVKVSVNGNFVGMFIARSTDFKPYSLIIPGNLMAQSAENIIMFELFDTLSPTKSGYNSDPRLLGLAINKVRFSTDMDNAQKILANAEAKQETLTDTLKDKDGMCQ